MKNVNFNEDMQQPLFPNKMLNASGDGILLIDFFAVKAMEQLLIKDDVQNIPSKAYKIAKEMIEERKKYFNPSSTYYAP